METGLPAGAAYVLHAAIPCVLSQEYLDVDAVVLAGVRVGDADVAVGEIGDVDCAVVGVVAVVDVGSVVCDEVC